MAASDGGRDRFCGPGSMSSSQDPLRRQPLLSEPASVEPLQEQNAQKQPDLRDLQAKNCRPQNSLGGFPTSADLPRAMGTYALTTRPFTKPRNSLKGFDAG